jgi:DNA polymerase-3 subunit delta
MQIYANQLDSQLKRGLAPVYLLYGEEPLLVEECRDRIREAARSAGFDGRELHTVEAGFDWNALFAASQSLSLFAEKRFIDLRLPSGKPGDAGGKLLAELASRPPADTMLVVSCGKLEKAQREAKWAKALDAAGAVVAVYPVEAAQLPGWVAQRLRARGAQAGPGVAELLAHHFEGNLLACAQEIDKLAMTYAAGAIKVEDIEQDIAGAARFTVFVLADACLDGRSQAIPRILNSLRAEGIEPVLVLWALVREIRTLAQIAASVAGGLPLAQALDSHKVWTKRKPLVSRALNRGRPGEWRAWLARAARVDRVIKGRARGDAWRELECLALGFGGLRLPTCR